MKSIKHIVLTLCALGFVATASAQGPFFGQFDYSAKAGISIAKMCNTDSRLAFTAGVRLEMSENPNEFNPRKYLGLGQSAVYENTINEITNIMDSADRLR